MYLIGNVTYRKSIIGNVTEPSKGLKINFSAIPLPSFFYIMLSYQSTVHRLFSKVDPGDTCTFLGEEELDDL